MSETRSRNATKIGNSTKNTLNQSGDDVAHVNREYTRFIVQISNLSHRHGIVATTVISSTAAAADLSVVVVVAG